MTEACKVHVPLREWTPDCPLFRFSYDLEVPGREKPARIRITIDVCVICGLLFGAREIE